MSDPTPSRHLFGLPAETLRDQFGLGAYEVTKIGGSWSTTTRKSLKGQQKKDTKKDKQITYQEKDQEIIHSISRKHICFVCLQVQCSNRACCLQVPCSRCAGNPTHQGHDLQYLVKGPTKRCVFLLSRQWEHKIPGMRSGILWKKTSVSVSLLFQKNMKSIWSSGIWPPPVFGRTATKAPSKEAATQMGIVDGMIVDDSYDSHAKKKKKTQPTGVGPCQPPGCLLYTPSRLLTIQNPLSIWSSQWTWIVRYALALPHVSSKAENNHN